MLQTYEGSYGADDQQQAGDADGGETAVADMKSGSKSTTPIAPQAPVSKKVPVVNAPQNLDSNPTVRVEKAEEFTKKCPDGQGNDYTAAGLECIEVLVAGYPCRAVQMLSDDTLECIAPDYIGANHSITVIVVNQSTSAMSNNEKGATIGIRCPKRAFETKRDQI